MSLKAVQFTTLQVSLKQCLKDLEMIYLPWDSIENVPANIRTHQGVKLTLAQANRWAALFDAIKAAGGAENPAAVAWAQWNREYKKSEDGTKWEKREKALSLSLREVNRTVVLQGSAVQSLLDKYPATEDEKAYLVFRKRTGEDVRGWHVDELLFIDEPTEDILKDILWEGEFRLFEVHPDIAQVVGDAYVDELPAGGVGFKIDYEKSITPMASPTEEELQQEFEPPQAGEDAPQGVKDILKKVYQGCREKWAKAHPDDIENAANKESCSRIAWHAVEQAGWRKGADGKWTKGTAASLSHVECELVECPTCDDDKMFSTAPKLEKMSEEEADRTGETELLMLNGTAIAEGIWKGTEFTADVLMEGLERVSNKRIDVEHEDETWEDVKGFNYKPRWNEELNGIDISGAIFDQRVIDWHKANPDAKIGLSVRMSPNAKFEIINGQKTCTYFDIKGIALTLKPACKVCWVNDAEAIKLSSSPDDQSGGGEKMVDEKPKEEKKEEEQPQEKPEDKKPVEAPPEAPKEEKQPEDKSGAEANPPPAAEAPTDAPVSLSDFKALKAEVEQLKQANETLHTERSLSETKTLVDGLIEAGQLSEAQREDATTTLMALSSDKDRAAFLNTIGQNQSWKAGEKGLVLSQDEDKDKDTDLQFSEPDRSVIT